MNKYIAIFLYLFCVQKVFSQNYFVPAGTPAAEVKITKETTKQLIYRKDTVLMIDYKTIDFKNTYSLNFPTKAADGKYVLFYENDTSKIYASISYFKGLKNGAYTKYYSNSTVEYYINYFIGKLNGEYKHYNSNGKLEFSDYYIDDKQYGEHISYNDDGTINYIAHYKSGKPHGIFKEWKKYLNGRKEYTEKYFVEGKEVSQ